MRLEQEQLHLTASDLVGNLNCKHLTYLDVKVATGEVLKPKYWDPLLEILRERGFRHEQAFIEYLRAAGFSVTKIEGVEVLDSSVSDTIEAMKMGAEIIVQGALKHGRWAGRIDILRRIETPSIFGNWSYEIIDTKLARETKGGTILQLCLYTYLLQEVQKYQPEYIYVVAPWSNYEPQRFRVSDYYAYFRKAKFAIEDAAKVEISSSTYPDPTHHCEICRWQDSCDKRRRDDDHLSFVAGISRNQITELKEKGVGKLKDLAELPTPISWKPKRGAVRSYDKIQKQAKIQADARETGKMLHELLSVEPGFGLYLLPEPSKGDIFFDLESDPFVGEFGLEYLFGYCYKENEDLLYKAEWALDREQEKLVFERFIDFVCERIKQYPDMHIYHFASYEPAALKRLMGRYATRENEVDDLLRRARFVDLYSVVRNGLRASVESYSIKQIEPFYGYKRNVSLRQANIALTRLNSCLEFNDNESISDADKETVLNYNKDDCLSTEALRSWLEELRTQLISEGYNIFRPPLSEKEASEEISQRQERINKIAEILTKDIPIAKESRSSEQQAKWILANILDWHRRENKAIYWELFRLKALSEEELIDERAGLSGLVYVGEIPATGKTKIPTHKYHFPQQDTDIRTDKDLYCVGGEKLGSVAEISTEERIIHIKKTGKTIDIHPAAVFTHEIIRSDEQADCLLRIGEYVANHGIEGEGKYLAARDLLMRNLPRTRGQLIQNENETASTAAMRLSECLEGGVLPIQGPPGTGKSHTAARMICGFVKQGLKVGITANSHKVIRNLLDKTLEASKELGIDVCCIQKAKEKEDDQDKLLFAKDNQALLSSIASGKCQVAGATGFLWAREDAFEAVDVMFVDEAAQMSLANVLAISHAAKRLILLGDPQQLDQPTQGTHPDGTGVSSLEHLLGDHKTIEYGRGLFLAETWRMHPKICGFDSELFYENKLHSKEECRTQVIISDGNIKGFGLRYAGVSHTGNKSYSLEEAEAVERLVKSILSSNSRWIDRYGVEKKITIEDILIITPYNAQVFEIQQRLPKARIGTVDKFQGQEAPIAIYSMATSSHADAPRGMEFLYSANRFNVAISRAKCLAILVSSPEIFEAECRTPRQMQLVNAFCRYLELAEKI
mgnify:CR=1 FL=1